MRPLRPNVEPWHGHATEALLDWHHARASTFGFTTLIGAPAQYAAI
jgi:hypothetical protein